MQPSREFTFQSLNHSCRVRAGAAQCYQGKSPSFGSWPRKQGVEKFAWPPFGMDGSKYPEDPPSLSLIPRQSHGLQFAVPPSVCFLLLRGSRLNWNVSKQRQNLGLHTVALECARIYRICRMHYSRSHRTDKSQNGVPLPKPLQTMLPRSSGIGSQPEFMEHQVQRARLRSPQRGIRWREQRLQPVREAMDPTSSMKAIRHKLQAEPFGIKLVERRAQVAQSGRPLKGRRQPNKWNAVPLLYGFGQYMSVGDCYSRYWDSGSPCFCG